MPRLLILALTLWISTLTTEAQVASTAALHSEQKSIAPGQPFTVALQLSHPAEWHSYYKNSGGVELPPSIAWTLPDGFSAGPIQWPVPEVKDGYFGKSFIYMGSPVFLVELRAPASLQGGQTVTLTADVAWQICKQSCINENGSFTLTLPVAATAEKDATLTGLFREARARLPLEDAKLEISAVSEGGTADLVLRIRPASRIQGTPADFIPNEPFLHPASAGGSITREGDAWLVTLKRIQKDFLEKPVPQGKSISGILTGTAAIAIPDTVIASPPAKPVPFSKLLPILGGMLLGGLILNLMPCVFPVIGLKIMGFVQQAGEDR